MKTQLGLEQIVTLVVFISAASFLFLEISFQESKIKNKLEEEVILSKGLSVSYLLLEDVGFPPNWDQTYVQNGISSVKRFGLVDENYNQTYLLSLNKIKNFTSICKNNPRKFREILSNTRMNVFFYDKNHNLISSCEIYKFVNFVNITRVFSYIENNKVKLGIMMMVVGK